MIITKNAIYRQYPACYTVHANNKGIARRKSALVEAIAMRELEKITLEGVRYIVWDELRGASPEKNGIALLLSDRNGVGADVFLVLPKNRPLVVRAYAKDGSAIAVDDGVRRAAAFVLEKLTILKSGAEAVNAEVALDRVEVRLTDTFFARLFPSETSARIAV